MHVLISLQSCSSSLPSERRDAADIEHDIQRKLAEELRARNTTADAPQLRVPTFFRAQPKPGSLTALLDSAVKQHAAQRRQNLQSAQVEQLKRLLVEHCSEPSQDGSDAGAQAAVLSSLKSGGADFEVMQKGIAYDGFSQVATRFVELYGEETLRFFAPSTFMKLQRPLEGAVPIAAFIDYVKMKDYRVYLRHRIASFDLDQDGFLTESDLESLLVSLAEEMQYDMSPNVFDKWRIIAPRKVLFFLAKNGCVRVKDLLASSMLDEIINYDSIGSPYLPATDNWFAPEKSQAIYSKYLELDEDGDGKLSPSELSRLRCSEVEGNQRPGSMTDFFLRRVFEVHVHGVSDITGRPAMDLKDFSDFLLAWNSRGEPPSLKYFFKVLDLEHTGRLTSPVVAVFAKHVADLWVSKLRLWEYESLDVKDEIFDMVTPKNPEYITLADLAACGMGDIICGMLVDAQCYYEYDQRERLAQGDGDDGA